MLFRLRVLRRAAVALLALQAAGELADLLYKTPRRAAMACGLSRARKRPRDALSCVVDAVLAFGRCASGKVLQLAQMALG